MKTPIDICNAALVRIGSKPINSFNDNTDTSNTCSVRYDSCRQSVLRSHPWNCAMTRALLSPLTTTPVYGSEYQFQLPSDCLRVVQVNGKFKDDWWRVEGRLLLTSNIFTTDTSLKLLYTADITAVANFDPLLCDAIAAFLAWDICFKITQSLELKKELLEEYKGIVRNAKLPDSQEGSTKHLEADELLRSRLAGTTGIAWGMPMRNW